MFLGVGSFRADPLQFNTGNAGGTRQPNEQSQPQNPFKPVGGPDELSDVNNLFGSIWPPEEKVDANPFADRPGVSNAGSIGNGENEHGNVARKYVSNYFQTNPAGKPVKVRPPEPPLFGTYE